MIRTPGCPGFVRITGKSTPGLPLIEVSQNIMNPEPIPSDREVLAGLVERVTFHNQEAATAN